MRGKAAADDGATIPARITPAHAGKSDFAHPIPGKPQDHPRACGEKIQRLTRASCGGGSPPRMRGKAPHAGPLPRHGGITPAHAGKSICFARETLQARDHPRACGEKALRRYSRTCRRGSPPRMRGKEGLHRAPRRRGQDHPRACGEKEKGTSTPNLHEGSPPRMRGKDLSFFHDVIFLGITPAHAGKRQEQCARLMLMRDHPRACGEKSKMTLSFARISGSPPRMRGKV